MFGKVVSSELIHEAHEALDEILQDIPFAIRVRYAKQLLVLKMLVSSMHVACIATGYKKKSRREKAKKKVEASTNGEQQTEA